MYSRKVLEPLSTPGCRYSDELDMNIHSLVLPLCNTTVSPNIHKLCNSGLFSLPLGLSYTSLLHKSVSLNEATVDSKLSKKPF